jgi:hypothetical protein
MMLSSLGMGLRGMRPPAQQTPLLVELSQLHHHVVNCTPGEHGDNLNRERLGKVEGVLHHAAAW